MNNPILSICIPTRNRKDFLEKTLNSIFLNSSLGNDFEVVIYDSSDDFSIRDLVSEKFKFENVRYVHGENFGYFNLIEALKLGQGSFLKLHNDYSLFKDGALDVLLDFIKSSTVNKSVIIFSNGLFNAKSTLTYSTFDEFMYRISFYSSWSTLLGVWKDDFDKFSDNFEPMFPHTSVLFSLNNKERYIVNDSPFFENLIVSNKGGYNLYETFAVTFVGMVKDLRDNQLISEKTYEYIKKDLFRNFLVMWYLNIKILKGYSFGSSNIKASMNQYYGVMSYYKMILFAHLMYFKRLVKTIFQRS